MLHAITGACGGNAKEIFAHQPEANTAMHTSLLCNRYNPFISELGVDLASICSSNI